MRTWALGLALLGLPAVARADPKDDARRHFGAGLQAAEDGQYEIALQRFLAAQAAYPHPATLYNIAKAYTDLDDLPNALTYYRLYQDASPGSAADVAPIIDVLEARLGQASAPADPVGAPASAAAGPTTEELTRLQDIAQELEALTDALKRRAEEEAQLTVADGEAEPGAKPEPVGVPELADQSFLEAAYERVVVTASRVGQDPLDSPSTIAVLTADDIRLSGATTVPDLLRRVAGVDAMMLTASHADVSIRGFNRKLNNKVLVLIDGRSTYLDAVGTTFWFAQPIQLEEIERIEVIRGPGSSVYGANAVTGVINIITRTPGEGDQVVTASGGTPGHVRAAAVASGRVENTAYRLSAGIDQVGRWAREYDLGGVDRPAVEPFFEDDTLSSSFLRMNVRVDHTFTEQVAASVSAGISEGRGEFFAIGALPNYYLDGQHNYVRADLVVGSLHLRGFWNSTSGDTGPWIAYVGEPRELDARVDDDVVDLELEAPVRFETGAMSHTLNVGGGWRYKRIGFDYLAGGFDNPFVENHFKGFVNEQAAIGRLGLVGSLRVDAHPLIPVSRTISPRAAVLYRIFDQTSLRATAGTAFRAPNSVESYMQLNLATPADGLFIEDLGDRETLLPERITTFEVGVHDASTYLHTADVVVYVNRVTDLIGLSDVTTAFNVFDPESNGIEVGETGWINQADAFTGVGVEVDGELYPTDGLDVFANVTWMQVFDTTASNSERDRSASEWKSNLGLSYRTPYRTDVSVTAHALSAQEWRLRTFDPQTLREVQVPEGVPARFLVSARVAVRPLADRDFEVAGAVWNLASLLSGDGVIEHPEGQPMLGRATASASYRF